MHSTANSAALSARLGTDGFEVGYNRRDQSTLEAAAVMRRSGMIKNSLIVVCTLSFALGLPSAARGCMCGMTTAEVSFVKAHVVFTGKVVRIAPVKKASVGLLMKEAGTLHLLKVPRWETFVDKARIVTLEISEGLKGTQNS